MLLEVAFIRMWEGRVQEMFHVLNFLSQTALENVCSAFGRNMDVLICWHMYLISIFHFVADLDKLRIFFICAFSVTICIYIC